jgi:hypothetical protein
MDSLTVPRAPRNSECDGRNMVALMVRSESPALLAFRATSSAQKGREAVGHGHRNAEGMPTEAVRR